jgi:hypothetical protein
LTFKAVGEDKKAMEVYWQHRKRGQNLVLNNEEDGHEEEIGGFRETKRGIDAYAKTFSYDPGRSERGFQTIEDAKAFVESFRPWELFENTEGLSVESEVRPALDGSTPEATTSVPEQPAEPVADTATLEQPVASGPIEDQAETGSPAQATESIAPSQPSGKRWWEFWKQG